MTVTVGVISAVKSGGSLLIEVCPNYRDGVGCSCPTGVFEEQHYRYSYGEQPLEDGRSADDYAAACAQESLLVVAATVSRSKTEDLVPNLIGMRLT